MLSKGLWNIVEGSVSKPPEGSKKIEKFQRRRENALSTILIPVHDSLVAPVKEMRDRKLVWRNLKNQHQAVSRTSRDGLLDRHQARKMKPEETVLRFRDRHSELEYQLEGIRYIIYEVEQLAWLA